MTALPPERLGPIARRLISPARWKDQYPAWPAFRLELDTLLAFGSETGFPDLVPRIESKAAQRDEMIQELRVAYFLQNNGFPIANWSPPGLNGKVGEYLVGSPEGQNIFVEVKSPGWEGQLSIAELKAGRANLPKYDKLGGGAVGNWIPVQKCIVAAYPKFNPTQANLLVIADDLRVGLCDSLFQVEIAVSNTHSGYGEMGHFTSSRFENLGGLGVFWYSVSRSKVEYHLKVFENPYALTSVGLPQSILKFSRTEEDIWI